MSVRDEILRCPECGELLVDNPRRSLLGSFLFLSGFLAIVGIQHYYGKVFIRDLLILFVSSFLFVIVRKLTITKKDFVIRNKETNEISYIDQADWEEIVENAKGKENNFEIIEKL